MRGDAQDPVPEPPPRPLRLGPGFWLAILFGVACIAAGYAVARLGPTLLAPRHAPPLGKPPTPR
jgi:hypothetical protein